MGCRVRGVGFSVQCLGCRVRGVGFSVQCLGCRVQGAGFAPGGEACAVRRGGTHAERNLPNRRRRQAASPRNPRKALRTLNQKSFLEDLSTFGDKCPQNGFKTAPTAPIPHLGCPHKGPSVADLRRTARGQTDLFNYGLRVVSNLWALKISSGHSAPCGR